MLTAEERINLMNSTNLVTDASTAKINAYYRSQFAEAEEDEGSPYREDDHVGSQGWGQD